MPQGPFNTLVAKLIGATAFSPLIMDKQSGLLASALHGDNYQQAYQGNLFWGASQAGATLSNGLATTYTGICLSNPAGSGKNVVIRRVAGDIVVAPAGMIGLGLITGYAVGGITVHTTPLAPTSSFINGSAVPVAKVDAACTLVGTPIWSQHFVSNGATTNNASFSLDLAGGFILPPGGYAAIGSVLAAGPTAGLLGSFQWEEVAP